MWYVVYEEYRTGMWVEMKEWFNSKEEMLKRYNELVHMYWRTGEPIHWGKEE